MKLFELDQTWKIWIYRIGITLNLLTIIGIILTITNLTLHWRKDILKLSKTPKLNGLLEKWFYIYGYLAILGIITGIILQCIKYT